MNDKDHNARWLVRVATNADAALIAAHNAAMAWETEGLRLEPERVSAGTRRVADDPSLGFYLVAEAGCVVAGQLMVTYEWSDWRNGCFWWIQSVYVVPEFRRKGVFRALFAHLQQVAHERGDVCGFRLYVERENRTAAAVYAALGLRESAYRVREIDLVLRDREPPA